MSQKEEKVTENELLVHDVHWDIDYKVRLGQAWSRFLVSLRDDKVILGARCTQCDRLYVPTQAYCESCFERIETWEEVPPTGTIQAATIARHAFVGGPPAPYAVAAIALDGADSLFIHLVAGVDLTDETSAREKLRSGTRVSAVWAENRTGSIRDIDYFAPTS
jgi:uncharacterized protein